MVVIWLIFRWSGNSQLNESAWLWAWKTHFKKDCCWNGIKKENKRERFQLIFLRGTSLWLLFFRGVLTVFLHESLAVSFLWVNYSPTLHLGHRFLSSSAEPSAFWHRAFSFQHWSLGICRADLQSPIFVALASWYRLARDFAVGCKNWTGSLGLQGAETWLVFSVWLE